MTLAVALSLSAPLAAMTSAHRRQVARSQFETAEKLREALSGRPAGERTRREYQRVLDAYRRVYYVAPGSGKADSSVVAVAELLAEMGRKFDDPKLSQAAIRQYEFLRREYPGSKYRVEALFTIGQIYREDLKDADNAKTSFEDFLKRYPHSHLGDDARDAISEIETEKTAAVKAAKRDKEREKPADLRPASDTDSGKHAGKLPLVTGVRQWSTPDYTRVAIDLEQQVKYQAGRVPNPDRIFFDLYDTRLAPELLGKTFEVEDGFLHKIRVAQFKRGLTRVVLEVDDVAEYSAFFLPNPDRLIIDIHGKQDATTVAKAATPPEEAAPPTLSLPTSATPKAKSVAAKSRPPAKPAGDGDAAKGPWPAPLTSKDSGTMEMAALTEPEIKATSKPTTSPTFQSVSPRATRATAPRGKKTAREKPASLVHEAKPTANGEQTLIRALGLKIGRIVVDAGHGGHDTGTIGPDGYTEKALVLDVALRLGKLLENRLGAEVVYTRDDDTFVPLETRTAIANKEQADLFISIHANSSRDPEARGVETYYLNFTSSPDALEVAARENAVSEKSIHELQDLVKKIALKEKIEESREFAADVQQSLWATAGRGTRSRGVKKAPFIVLIGANMPSILAEISFLSNPGDEHKLETGEYRQKIAEALYRGVAKYVSGLSGLKMATKMPKDAGQ